MAHNIAIAIGAALATATACGEVVPLDPDAGAAADTGTAARDGAPPETPGCLARRFRTPTLLAGVNSAAVEADGWLADDQLTAYVRSTRAGGLGDNDLYTARRADRTAAFAAPVLIAGINTAASDTNAVVAGDGLTVYLASNRGGTNHDIYVATRATVASAFGTPQLLLNVSSGADDVPNWINPAQTRLYLTSNRSGNQDLYVASRASADVAFGPAVALAALNSPVYDYVPILTPDELTVWFQSQRAGGVGVTDIWMAQRASIDAAFGAPVNVSELNTPSSESPNWLSPDGCELTITSDRPGGSGGFDIWIASRR